MTKFECGQVVATPGALKALEEAGDNPASFLHKHLTGDWGVLDEHDRKANDRAIENEERILSAYHLTDGTKIWIITEADRSSTTVLLPEEY